MYEEKIRPTLGSICTLIKSQSAVKKHDIRLLVFYGTKGLLNLHRIYMVAHTYTLDFTHKYTVRYFFLSIAHLVISPPHRIRLVTPSIRLRSEIEGSKL